MDGEGARESQSAFSPERGSHDIDAHRIEMVAGIKDTK
jgi:hypothetical protein